jgi:ABC-2 type transport system permease protein
MTQPIRIRDQFAALAFLRFRLFVNAFRSKGTTSDIVARIVLFPLLGFLAMLPIAGSASVAWFAIQTHHPGAIGLVAWGIFAVSVLLSINLGQATLAFEPSSLVRFPLSFPSYLLTRIFLGLLSVSTVICSLSLAAAAIAIGIARPRLFAVAVLAFGLYALALMLFTRMAFAWVDRWLATRRTREILTGLVFLFGLSAQFINFYITGDKTHQRLGRLIGHRDLSRHIPHLLASLRQLHVITNFLPPGLAASAITASIPSHATPSFSFAALGYLLGIVLFAAAYLSIFALRMKKEFLGESLSEAVAPPSQPAPAADEDLHRERRSHLRIDIAPTADTLPASATVILACVRKEILYLRRSSPILFLLLSPLVMVYFFASRMGAAPAMAPFIFPAAVAYSLLGVSGGAYNTFGPDLNGVQLYLLAPIRLRDVLFAKNLVGFATLAFQVLLTWMIVSLSLHVPSAATSATTFLWVVFAISVNTSIANYRSVTRPTRVKPSGKQARPVSALLSLGIMIACALLGAIAFALAFYFKTPWPPASSPC